jgi:peroxiredoxin (alkyl hydroperoxide reductase subunit C)
LVSKDFTFVCPTELHAFKMLYRFEKDTIVVVLLAIQTKVHFAWLNTAKGGIEGVTPILADTNRNLSNILGILDIRIYWEDSVMVEGSNI